MTSPIQEEADRLALRPKEAARLHPELERVGISIEEAAASVGLSTRAFRDHLLALCPKIHVGTRLVIPLNPFRAYIEGLAREEPPQPTARELRETVRE